MVSNRISSETTSVWNMRKLFALKIREIMTMLFFSKTGLCATNLFVFFAHESLCGILFLKFHFLVHIVIWCIFHQWSLFNFKKNKHSRVSATCIFVSVRTKVVMCQFQSKYSKSCNTQDLFSTYLLKNVNFWQLTCLNKI